MNPRIFLLSWPQEVRRTTKEISARNIYRPTSCAPGYQRQRWRKHHVVYRLMIETISGKRLSRQVEDESYKRGQLTAALVRRLEEFVH